MKKLTFIVFTILFGLIGTPVILAQGDDLFSAMEEHLTNDEKDQIQRAKDNLAKGDKVEDQIRAEEAKNQKYLDKKSKKTEKKTVEAKSLRVKQAQFYEKGYELIYTVYSEKLDACVFAYSEDEAKVKDILDEASTDNASAKRKMKEFKGLNEKDLKKKVEYSKLKSDLQSALNLYISSIKNLISGYAIYLDQENKKQVEEEENRVWQNAQSENSIQGYQAYLNDYPNGKYAADARTQIEALEEKQRKDIEDQSRSLSSNVVFQVQIAASRVKLSKAKISSFYKAINDVTERYYDNWYKYSVGSFKTYDDARNFLPKTKVKGAFVVAYQNDKKVEIQESMKGKK